MISISGIAYYIGGRALYENASLSIKPKDKIGLIGLNGQGKTTLLRLINGEYAPDKGSISYSNDCTIGFLNQDLLSYQSDDSILNVAMSAFKEAIDTQHAIDRTLAEMEANYSDELVDKLTRLQENFEKLGGYSIQSKAEEVLEGIGFATKDLHRPLREFSGGWRMRVMLAKLLLENPSLLMLDEPTNHLDLPSIEWVENYLRSYPGAVIIVSHDSRFLDNVTNRTVEVVNQQLEQYEGNYSYYLEERQLRKEIQRNAYENQQQQIRQTERFIERFRSKASKARQVQSRVKQLAKMELVDEVVDGVAAVNFRFTFQKPSGRHVMQLKGISKSYGDLELLRDASASIERGDKIALIGANGKGKSTLLRILVGTEEFQGERILGHNVTSAFYAQHQLEALDTENEILEELKQAGSGKTEQQLRNVLGCFLFSDEDVFKKIKVLSGGEKSRVALAKTLISEANFLLLDEPTNHLDFISEDILTQALQQYQGTFVVVSHDREFVSQIANKIWYIENKQIVEYPGTYEEYTYWRKQNEKKTEVDKPVKKVVQEVPKKNPPKESNTLSLLNKELRKVEERMEDLQKKIDILEKELAQPEVYGNFEKLQEVQKRYDATKSELDAAAKTWDELAGEIDRSGQE